MTNKALGGFGEAWAVGYLARKGYRILERNVRYRCGELDIVAREGSDIVFVEVKCRRTARYGAPQSSITPARFEHLNRAIAEYVQVHGLEDQNYRIDVVAIVVGKGGAVVRAELLQGVEAPGA
ncbi:MAG: YraN family protein [Chloroflexota bacterium]